MVHGRHTTAAQLTHNLVPPNLSDSHGLNLLKTSLIVQRFPVAIPGKTQEGSNQLKGPLPNGQTSDYECAEVVSAGYSNSASRKLQQDH